MNTECRIFVKKYAYIPISMKEYRTSLQIVSADYPQNIRSCLFIDMPYQIGSGCSEFKLILYSLIEICH